MTVLWFGMSHRLVKEQLDQLTALLPIAHEDGDLDEEELLLLLLACVEEVAAASLLPLLQFVGRKPCLDQLEHTHCLCIYRKGIPQRLSKNGTMQR